MDIPLLIYCGPHVEIDHLIDVRASLSIVYIVGATAAFFAGDCGRVGDFLLLTILATSIELVPLLIRKTCPGVQQDASNDWYRALLFTVSILTAVFAFMTTVLLFSAYTVSINCNLGIQVATILNSMYHFVAGPVIGISCIKFSIWQQVQRPVPPTQKQIESVYTVRRINTGARRASAPAKDTLRCAICLSPMCARQSIAILPCNHEYHNDCIRQWLARSGQCPMCRSRLTAP